MPTSRKGEKMIEMLNCDCMDYMATVPDKAFDLAIVDPPYGIDVIDSVYKNREEYEHKINKGKAIKAQFLLKDFDKKKCNKKYFNELFRVSKNQIVWGGNYYTNFLHQSRGWIFWDKIRYDNDFADGELAWTSFDCNTKQFRFMWNGMLQGKSITEGETNQGNKKKCEIKIHPTQKPVALYKWLLSRYAHPGDKILDTHGGSGSICIACHDLGYDLTWMELDSDYYAAACKRYKDHAAQAVLFEPQEITRKTYNNEFDLTS